MPLVKFSVPSEALSLLSIFSEEDNRMAHKIWNSSEKRTKCPKGAKQLRCTFNGFHEISNGFSVDERKMNGLEIHVSDLRRSKEF